MHMVKREKYLEKMPVYYCPFLFDCTLKFLEFIAHLKIEEWAIKIYCYYRAPVRASHNFVQLNHVDVLFTLHSYYVRYVIDFDNYVFFLFLFCLVTNLFMFFIFFTANSKISLLHYNSATAKCIFVNFLAFVFPLAAKHENYITQFYYFFFFCWKGCKGTQTWENLVDEVMQPQLHHRTKWCFPLFLRWRNNNHLVDAS